MPPPSKDAKAKLSRDILEMRNRYRRTITNLEAFIGDIMGVSKDMIQLIRADPNSKKYGAYLAKILKNLQTMNEIINKVYNNKNMINPEPVLVDKTLEFLLNGKKTLPQFSQIKISEEFNAPEIRTVIDRTEFEELMTHLLNNAQEAIESGGKITVRTFYVAEKKQIRIEVEDNGCGISNSIRPHIFSRHFTSKEGKEGLGLAIVANTVQAYSGTIDMESGGENKGCVFTVILPENHDLYDEVKYYKNKFYYTKKVEDFIQKFILGWDDGKQNALMEELYQLDPGYKCLSKEQVNTLLQQKKEYFMGRKRQ